MDPDDHLIFNLRVPDEEREARLRDEFPTLKGCPLFSGEDWRDSQDLHVIVYPEAHYMRSCLHTYGEVIWCGSCCDVRRRNFSDDSILLLLHRSIRLGCEIYDCMGNDVGHTFREKLV